MKNNILAKICLVIISLAACSSLLAAEDAEDIMSVFMRSEPIPARTFNSELPLRVRAVIVDGRERHGIDIGSTPSDQPLEIPECEMWMIMPYSNQNLDKVVAEIHAQDIPGLWLPDGSNDNDLARLEPLDELQWLTLNDSVFITNDGMESLKPLAGLRTLDMSRVRVADAGLEHLAELHNLLTLIADGTAVTGEGLRHLAFLPNFQNLALTNSGHITDSSLEHLNKLIDLKRLSLDGANIGDATLENIGGLTALQSLSLERCGNITDDGLRHLASISGLRILYLSETRITDAGLAHLAGFDDLLVLHLASTGVSDAGLSLLADMPNLMAVDLSYCAGVTEAGIEELRKARPDVEVVWAGPPVERPEDRWAALDSPIVRLVVLLVVISLLLFLWLAVRRKKPASGRD